MSGHYLLVPGFREGFIALLNETKSILCPVLLCIVLTQIGWVNVYDCKTTKNLFFFDSENKVWDGIANAAAAMVVIALVSVLMITLAIYNFRRVVEAWLSLSCIVVSFVIAGTLFQDGAAKLPYDEQTQLAIGGTLTALYGGGALVAFYWTSMPPWYHQLYVVTNCASIATFYLTCLPGHTTWFLLSAIVVWDCFAVLAPIGPLKLALERSQDYGADILRFMMFTTDSAPSYDTEGLCTCQNISISSEDEESDAEEVAEADDARPPVRRLAGGADGSCIAKRMGRPSASGDEAQEESESDSEEDSDTFSTASDSDTSSSGRSLNARDALNSGSHLGFGDFIFYSILVGKSMVTGLMPAMTSTVGVLTGLMLTLTIKSESETLPALPVSIIFGMFGHVYTLGTMELGRIAHEYYESFSRA